MAEDASADIADRNEPGKKVLPTEWCQRIWNYLLDPAAEDGGIAGSFPDKIANADIQAWLDGNPSGRQIDLFEQKPEDLQFLEDAGFSKRFVDSLLHDPQPTHGAEARRALDFPPTSRTLKWDREVKFQYDIIRNHNYFHAHPFGKSRISSSAGFWFHHQLLCYYFHCEHPFFVFLSTVPTRRTILYFPTLDLRLLTSDAEWRDPAEVIDRLRRHWVSRWKAVKRQIDREEKLTAYHVGFCWNIAHNLRDDLGGLHAIIRQGLLEKIDRVVVGNKQLFGKVEKLFPEIPKEKLDLIPGDYKPDDICNHYTDNGYFPVRVFGTFVFRDLAERVVATAMEDCDPGEIARIEKARRQHFPLLGVTIRTRGRSWQDQSSGILEIAKDLAQNYPDIGIVFDGVNDLADERLVDEEKSFVAELIKDLESAGVASFDTIGAPMSQSIAWANNIDAYVAPHGAGLAKHHWLAGKPGVVHAGNGILKTVESHCYDGFDLEEANVPLFVSSHSVETVAGSGEVFRRGPGDLRKLDQYKCDWRAVARLVRLVVQRCDLAGRPEALAQRRAPTMGRNHTHHLKAGFTAAKTLETQPRCSYGLYTSRKARAVGLNDQPPMIVYLSGLAQGFPPGKMLEMADRIGAIVVYPYFPADLAGPFDPHAYCFLKADGVRFNELLIEMLDEISLRFGIVVGRFFLCGGSGGAQFINRFLLLHPERVAGASMVAPGTVTLPSSQDPWWIGMGDVKEHFGVEPDLRHLEGMPIQIVIGEKDTSPTGGLSGKHFIDQPEKIGKNRLERALALAEDLTAHGATVDVTRIPDMAHNLPRMWGHATEYLERVVPTADRTRSDAAIVRRANTGARPAVSGKVDTKFAVILATQRSGTTSLGHAIEAAFDLKWLGEVFLSDQADPSVDISKDANLDWPGLISPLLNFFNFKHRLTKENSHYAYPTPKNQEEIFQKYLDYLSIRTGRQNLIFDVKYDSWHNLNSYWSMPPNKPDLVKFVQQRGFPVIHLTRDNVFEIGCSMAIALETGVWQLKGARQKSEQKLALDIRDCEARMRAIQFNREWFTSMFDGYGGYCEVRYETMFEDNRLSHQTVSTVESALGLTAQTPAITPIQKTSPRLADVIENAEEVIDHFSGTEFEHLVLEALSGPPQER